MTARLAFLALAVVPATIITRTIRQWDRTANRANPGTAWDKGVTG